MPTFSRAPSPPTTLPFLARTMGRIQRDPYHSTLGTYNQDFMLTVVLSGSGRYLRDGQTFAVTSGMIGIVTPHEDPGLLIADPRTPYDHYYCRFAGNEAHRIARRVLQAQYARGTAQLFPFFRHAAIDRVSEVFARTLAHLKYRRPSQNMDRMSPTDARLAEILTLLDASTETTDLSANSYSIQLYLHEHLSDPINLEVMAEYFSISKAHLCRVAKKELGRTIQSLWEQIKMERARVLLAQSDLSVKEIARRVGYTDPFYFSNVFHRATGCSPRAFRTEH